MTHHTTTTKTPAKTVTVFVNNREIVLPDKEATGAEIKAAANIPLDFHLYVEHGSNLDPVDNNERIKVHQKERFRAVSGQDVS
jgi:hypothetical protein